MKNIEIKTIAVPSIISAKTYFWSPSGNASSRRRNEERRREEVESFLAGCGLVEVNGRFTNNEGLEVIFSYSESAKHVYKSLKIFRGGKKSNIKGMAADLRKKGIQLV